MTIELDLLHSEGTSPAQLTFGSCQVARLLEHLRQQVLVTGPVRIQAGRTMPLHLLIDSSVNLNSWSGQLLAVVPSFHRVSPLMHRDEAPLFLPAFLSVVWAWSLVGLLFSGFLFLNMRSFNH